MIKSKSARFFALILAVILLVACTATVLVACDFGQSVKFKVTFDVDGEAYFAIDTQGSEVLQMPSDPTKDGFVFDGWFWDKDTWNRPFTANSLLNEPLKEDMRVYAKWTDENEIEKFTVTFETNGGTTLQPAYCAFVKTQPVTNKDYNTFLGWYTDANFNESAKVTFPYTVTEDVTFYAKWSINFTDGIQFSLQTSSNSYFVSGYTGVETSLVIPDTYNGVPVTGIVARAFEGNSILTEVMIPNSITSIGDDVFKDCSNLTNITIPNSVTSIGNYVFYGCTRLTSITIPDSVTSIGDWAFYGCSGLEAVHITDLAKWCGITFGNNSANPLYYAHNLYLNGEIVTDLIIPDSVTSIDNHAFHNCNGITNVTIGNSVTSIGNAAFSGCTGLTNITIPDSVTSIGNYAFSDCTGLTSITIPNNVTSIGDDAFRDCSGLTSITIPNSVTNIGRYAFIGCRSLTSITIPDSVTSIGDDAFYGCSNLTSITIPNSVTSIGKSAFYGCSALKQVYITDIAKWCEISFDSYNANPLYYALNLFLNGELLTGDLVIPDGVTRIGAYAFKNCSKLTSITIPNSVTSIGRAAFSGCSELKRITIPFVGASKNEKNNTSLEYIFVSETFRLVPYNLKEVIITGGEIIDSKAFYNCVHLTSITIPDSVTSIGNEAFYGCCDLTSIAIPDSVTNIGESAFNGCSGITSITIPFVGASKNEKNNTHFGYIFGAKSYTNNSKYVPLSLKNVIITNATHINAVAFKGCRGLTSITIPNSATSIGAGAFQDCSGLTSITIPNSVTSIGGDAFQDCTGLKEVYITDIAKWCGISFSSWYANPLFYAHNLYLNGELVTDLVIPDNVTSIGNDAFRGCSRIRSITIPDSVTSIGDAAFVGTSWYNNQPDGLVYAGKVAYTYKNYIDYPVGSITLKDGTLGIADSAFSACTKLKRITIPDSVTTIGSYVFFRCFKLESITIPDSVTTIGNGAFMHCSELTSITIPDSVTSIGDDAFTGCSNLTSIIISNNVTSIGEEAFWGCSNLTSITIPDSVTSIGNGAFMECSNLTSITIPNSVMSIGDCAFGGCSNLTSITIPDSVTSIGNSAFSGCTGLTSITIPNSVTSIGDFAFSGCSGLKNIFYQGTREQWDAIKKGSGWFPNIVYCT